MEILILLIFVSVILVGAAVRSSRGPSGKEHSIKPIALPYSRLTMKSP